MHKCVLLVLPFLAATAASPLACSPDPTRVEPPVQPLVIGTSPGPMPIATAPEQEAPASASDGPSDTRPLAITARDPRLASGRTRPRALVVTELQALEQLFAAVTPGAPDRPMIARRLAEDYAELERISDGVTAASARRSSLKYYELIVAEHPGYPQIDEVRYYVGLAHERGGDAAKARRAYFELIQRSPQSKLIPLAYFAFGEMFFDEGPNDASKYALAQQAFLEVLKYPASSNAVFADALLRLGESYEGNSEPQKAKETYARLARDFPTSEAARNIPSAASRPLRRP